MTDLLALEVDYDNQEISRLNIGSERSFLSGRTGDISTKASVSGTQSDVIHGDVGGNGTSVINTGKAAFETAAITAYYNLLAPHYNQLFKT